LLPLVCLAPEWLRDRRWLIGAAIFTTTALLGSYGPSLLSSVRHRPLVIMSLVCLVPISLYLGWIWLDGRSRWKAVG